MRALVPVRRSTGAPLQLTAVLALALGLRIWTFRPFALHHPDELYQYLEQAHRLAFGFGIVPWEYRDGIRSLLVPLLLSFPMRLGEAIAPGGDLPIVLARGLVMTIGLAPVGAAWALGLRCSRLHALVAATVTALWYEGVYFSDHVLTEVLAVACFLPAAALVGSGVEARSTRAIARLAAGGALLALAAVLRFQYAPAIAVFALVTLRTDWQRWIPVAGGGLAMLSVAAGVDLAMGQLPFSWIAANIRENLIQGGANQFGVLGPLAYPQMLWLHWSIAAPLLLLLPLVMHRYPGLLWAAVTNLVVHMAIGHKEYRFLWLTSQLLVLLTAIASAELLRLGFERWRIGPRGRAAGTAGLLALWAGLSALLAAYNPLWPNWNLYAARTAAMADAGRTPGLCGVAVYRIPYWSGAYAYLRQNVPLYYPYADKAHMASVLAAHAPAYNAIVAPGSGMDAPADVKPGSAADIPPAYRAAICREDGDERICVYRRSGGCQAAGHESMLLQRVIERFHR